MLERKLIFSEDEKGALLGVVHIIKLDSLPLIFFIIPIIRNIEDCKHWLIGYEGDWKNKHN